MIDTNKLSRIGHLIIRIYRFKLAWAELDPTATGYIQQQDIGKFLHVSLVLVLCCASI